MKVRLFRNKSRRTFGFLRVNRTYFVWIGPLFVIVTNRLSREAESPRCKWCDHRHAPTTEPAVDGGFLDCDCECVH